MSKPKWNSSFYEGAAEAARREADEAAKFDFRARAAQLAMAARDIAALESINAELVEALEVALGDIDTMEAAISADASSYDAAGLLNTFGHMRRSMSAAIAKAKGETE